MSGLIERVLHTW